jgi:hypothetical protein
MELLSFGHAGSLAQVFRVVMPTSLAYGDLTVVMRGKPLRRHARQLFPWSCPGLTMRFLGKRETVWIAASSPAMMNGKRVFDAGYPNTAHHSSNTLHHSRGAFSAPELCP